MLATKTLRLLVLSGLIAGTIIVIWQARTIAELRAEVAELRQELQVALGDARDEPTGVSSEPGPARREQLELIKLRHQVRELRETLAASHATDRTGGLRAAMNLLLTRPAPSGPWKIRPEWRGMESSASNQYNQVIQTLSGTTNEYVRFLNLPRAARMSLAVGLTGDARQFAADLIVLDDKFSRGDPTKANGQAVHDVNIVLGTIAADEGRINEAKKHLLAAGKTSGSPSLGSFGPNMSLAKALLEKGEQETVLQYLELCRKFWGSYSEKLDEWVKDIHAGRIPEFGSNLLH